MVSASGRHALRWALAGLCTGIEPKPGDDSPIIKALLGLANRYPRYGFGKLFAGLRRQGFHWNHKRVYRVYCLLKMNLRRKGKKLLPSRTPQALVVPPCANVCWSIDFMHDALARVGSSGRSMCWMTSAVGVWRSKWIRTCQRQGSCGF